MNSDYRSNSAERRRAAFAEFASGSELYGIGARLFFVASSCVIIVASLISAPRILYSYHVSHFAVLYVLSLATLAAFPGWAPLKTFWRLMGFVTALSLARVIFRHHVEANFFDWIADVSGILGGLAPLVVQHMREFQLNRQWSG
jgi:hypothetical protein